MCKLSGLTNNGARCAPPQKVIQTMAFSSHHFARLSGLGLFVALAGCGGGGGGSAPSGGNVTPPVANASPGGIWQGIDPISNLTVTGIVTESGDLRFLRSDGAQYIGTVTTSANSVTGTYSGYLPTGYIFTDGSTQGTGSLSGTVSARQSLSATLQFTTSKNTRSTGSGTFTFNSLYNSGSSFQKIAGNYTDRTTGATINVNGTGVIFSQDAVSGCIINGSISIINSSYNAYAISYTFGSCRGSYTYLNNTTATGLATLDTTVTPNVAYIGVSNANAGYVLTQALPRL